MLAVEGLLEAGLVLDAMHAGVKEFVTLPVNQQKFLASLERVAHVAGLDKRANYSSSTANGRLVDPASPCADRAP